VVFGELPPDAQRRRWAGESSETPNVPTELHSDPVLRDQSESWEEAVARTVALCEAAVLECQQALRGLAVLLAQHEPEMIQASLVGHSNGNGAAGAAVRESLVRRLSPEAEAAILRRVARWKEG